MKKITLLIIVFMVISCYGQNKPIGDAPLSLDNFDFNTTISQLFPEKYKSKTYENAYEVKGDELGSFMFQKDTTFVSSGGRKAIGYEYRQINWSSQASLASFQQYMFQKINVATTMEGGVKVIGAVADEMTSAESGRLLKALNEKYGPPKKLKGSWKENLVIYEWTKKDRIVRFATVYDNEKGMLKIEIDKEKKTIAEGKKTPHFKSYLFVINAALKNEVFGKLNTGDFVY
ncbi:hypothetical protein [Chryseobacterium sp.]|uniref:hypothetical protein n=1 Tax=Chryseobacterium sp. TaxID=1871047 RepID=UPI00321B1B84